MKKVTQILSVFVVVFIFLLQCFYFVNLTVADTAVNLKKGKALIVVNYDKEKVLYTSLVEREQNFDFQIEIVSLQEKKVPRGDAKKIKEFLWDQKDRYKFFVLDEEIKTYQINKDEFYSDYFYAHDDGFFAYDERAAIKWGDTLRRYPGLILSRVKRSQIEYYAKEKNRLESNSFSLDLPFFAFNRDQPSCGVGNYQTDLSYIGWFLKTKFQKLDATIKITHFLIAYLVTHIQNTKLDFRQEKNRISH